MNAVVMPGFDGAVQAMRDRLQEEDERAIAQWRHELPEVDGRPGGDWATGTRVVSAPSSAAVQ